MIGERSIQSEIARLFIPLSIEVNVFLLECIFYMQGLKQVEIRLIMGA